MRSNQLRVTVVSPINNTNAPLIRRLVGAAESVRPIRNASRRSVVTGSMGAPVKGRYHQ